MPEALVDLKKAKVRSNRVRQAMYDLVDDEGNVSEDNLGEYRGHLSELSLWERTVDSKRQEADMGAFERERADVSWPPPVERTSSGRRTSHCSRTS